MDDAQAALARLVDRPETVQSVEELLSILLPPLAWFGALPPALHDQYATCPAPASLGPWWGAVQHAVLSNTLVTWGEALRAANMYTLLLDGLFTPESERAAQVWQYTLATCSEQLSAATRASGTAALHPHTAKALAHILEQLACHDLVVRLLRAADADRRAAARDLVWSESVARLVNLPTRAANVFERKTPECMAPQTFLARVARDWERALDVAEPARLAELLAKLAKSGYVAHGTHGCFWDAVLPAVVQRVQAGVAFAPSYTQAWRAVFDQLGPCQAPLVYALAQQLDACLAQTSCAWPVALTEHAPGTEGRAFLSPPAASARDAAYAILALVASSDEIEPLELVRLGPAFPSTLWSPLLSLALAAWMRAGVLTDLVEYWASADRCARTSVKQEQMLTTMLLAFTTDSGTRATWESLAHSPLFLQGVSCHLDHNDPVVRRLGMLVAECVSAVSVAPGTAPLRFPASVWDGRGDGREVCRVLRAMRDSFDFAAVREARADRSAWRAALHLEAHAEAVVPRAVHEPQGPPPRAAPATRRLPARVPPKAPSATARPLIQVLEDDHEDTDEFHTYAAPPEHDVSSDEGADSSEEDAGADGADEGTTLDAAFAKPRRAPVYIHELAPLARERDVQAHKTLLKHAEPLVRRKTGWGHEIAEQAVDLCVALCALQDHFGLRAFEERRTAALAALCVACPDPVADCVYEQLFQPHYAVAQRISMLHAVARAAQELAGARVESVGEAATKLADDAASHARDTGERQAAAADPARHAARVQRNAVRAAFSSDAPLPFAPQGSVRPTVAYTMAALGTFLFPLLNRFWTYRQAHRQRRVSYAGSDVILSDAVLNAVLQTLAVLCYYAQNAPHFYARLVPDVLEMVDSVLITERGALVAGAALSLALIVLQATWQAGQGLALVRAHAPLLARLQDAAQALFAEQETRAGVDAPTRDLLESPDARARRVAAAVVVQLAELQSDAQKAFFEAARIW